MKSYPKEEGEGAEEFAEVDETDIDEVLEKICDMKKVRKEN